MGRLKPRGRYLAISVPIDLHKEISEYVGKSSYNSIAEFVKIAVREKIQNDTKKEQGTVQLKEDDIVTIVNRVLAHGYDKIKKKKRD